MSIVIISELTPISRKEYECNACLWLLDYLNDQPRDTGLTISELRTVVKVKRNGWKIKPGDKYLRQVQKFEGEISTVRSIPAIDEICQRHDLYPEWY